MKTALVFMMMAAFALVPLLAVHSMVAQARSSAVRADQLGLSKISVFETPAPPVTKSNTSDPGDHGTVEPDFPQQPPVVPHGIQEFLPIVSGDNMCIDCHAVEEKEPGEPTPIPRSHYVDLRNAPDTEEDHVVGSRFVCTSCHVSPGGNEPLVGNSFADVPSQ